MLVFKESCIYRVSQEAFCYLRGCCRAAINQMVMILEILKRETSPLRVTPILNKSDKYLLIDGGRKSKWVAASNLDDSLFYIR